MGHTNKVKEAYNLVELVNNVENSIEIIVFENNQSLYEKSEDEITTSGADALIEAISRRSI